LIEVSALSAVLILLGVFLIGVALGLSLEEDKK